MPKTIMSVYEPGKNAEEVVKELIEKQIVASVGSKGKIVLGRHYLTRQQLRNAYYRMETRNA